jgi:hypothetical protein
MEMLEKLGFGRIWRDIVSGMLATSSMQILLNGVSGNPSHTDMALGKVIRYLPSYSSWLWTL